MGVCSGDGRQVNLFRFLEEISMSKGMQVPDVEGKSLLVIQYISLYGLSKAI